MIKTTVLVYKKFIPWLRGKGLSVDTHTTFIQYTAENNKSIYVVNGKLSTLEEGNRQFTQIRKKYKDVKVEKKIQETTNKEIIETLSNMIDQYTEYIDNYNQQKEAELANDRINNIINEFCRVANS